MRIQITSDLSDNVKSYQVPDGKNPIRIGRARGSDIELPSGYVPELAGEIRNSGDGKGWQFRAYFDGASVGGEPLSSRQPYPIRNNLAINVYPYDLVIYLEAKDQLTPAELEFNSFAERSAAAISELHKLLLETLDNSIAAVSTSQGDVGHADLRHTENYILMLERQIEHLAGLMPELTRDGLNITTLGTYFAGQCLRSELLRRVISKSRDLVDPRLSADINHWSIQRTKNPQSEALLHEEVESMLIRMELRAGDDLSVQVGTIESQFWKNWKDSSDRIPVDLQRYMFLRQIKKEIKDLWYGLGPLEDLLDNPTITEIMVNDAEHIYIEKDGVIENSGRRFVKDVNSIIQRIVASVQRRIDTTTPFVDARLPDGSRVNAVIKPLTVQGPCLTIRRFPKKPIDIDELIRLKSLTPACRDFLRAAVKFRCNVLVAGGTGTGKTTLLNALSGFIPDKERIITIEDTAELRPSNQHVVALETKPKNLEGAGEVSIRMLVKNALRMRPDRIIVGECRGGEALDMLQAMNTGHDGSMTTVHANSPEDVIKRLEIMVQQNSDSLLPTESIHRQVASAIDIIVQLQRQTFYHPDRPMEATHRRVVSEVVEVVDVDPERGGLILKPIFKRRSDGKLKPTGFLPTFLDQMISSRNLNIETLLNLDAQEE